MANHVSLLSLTTRQDAALKELLSRRAWSRGRGRSLAALVALLFAVLFRVLRRRRTTRFALAQQPVSACEGVATPAVVPRPKRGQSSPALLMMHCGETEESEPEEKPAAEAGLPTSLEEQPVHETYLPAASVEQEEMESLVDKAQSTLAVPIVFGTMVASTMFRAAADAVATVISSSAGSEADERTNAAEGSRAVAIKPSLASTRAGCADAVIMESSPAQHESCVKSRSASNRLLDASSCAPGEAGNAKAVTPEGADEHPGARSLAPSTATPAPLISLTRKEFCMNEECMNEEAPTAIAASASSVAPQSKSQEDVSGNTDSGSSAGDLWGAGAFMAWATRLSPEAVSDEERPQKSESRDIEGNLAEPEAEAEPGLRQEPPCSHGVAGVHDYADAGFAFWSWLVDERA